MSGVYRLEIHESAQELKQMLLKVSLKIKV